MLPGTANFTPPNPVNSTLFNVPPGGVTLKQDAARTFRISVESERLELNDFV